MKKLVTVIALGFAMSMGGAYAASHAGAPMKASSAAAPGKSASAPAPAAAAASAPGMTKQQNKMVDCNKDAKEKNLKGDERKSFMSSCLKEKSAAQKAQQEKMKTCNKDAGAKKLKGDERKKFMSTCLAA
jgi:uncharacterized protein HemX